MEELNKITIENYQTNDDNNEQINKQILYLQDEALYDNYIDIEGC